MGHSGTVVVWKYRDKPWECANIQRTV